MRIMKVMVLPGVLYGCETWTKTKTMEKKIDACKMWIWRRMLRVALTERRTNEARLQEIVAMRGGLSLLQRATKQKMMISEDVMRANGPEKEMVLTCGDGRRRRRGLPRKIWMKEMLVGKGMSLEELREASRKRSSWRMLTI